MQVNMYEAKTNLSSLIRLLDEEKEIVIANSGKPVAKLVKFEQPKERTLGAFSGKYKLPETQEEFDACNDEIAEMFGV